jgi:hypothetical protein
MDTQPPLPTGQENGQIEPDAPIEVTELFDFACQTKLWVSQKVIDEIADFSKKRDHKLKFLACLERYAKNGFWNYEGDQKPIRAEKGYGVHRIGIVDFLFRVYGFYEGEDRTSFIAVEAALKRDTSLNASDRKKLDRVAKIKQKGLFKKKATDGNYPRLAK